MTQDAASSSDWPNYHATLTDGTTVIPIVFSDGKGEPDIESFRLRTYPRTALKTSEGDSKYSDLEPPYFAIAQDDWTGGRGNEDFESDTSRYFDGHNVDTNKESGVVLAGRETYSTGYKNLDQHMPGSVSFTSLLTTSRYVAVKFTSSAAYTSYQCEIWVKRSGDPDTGLQVELWSESGDEPNAMLATKTIAVDTVTTDVISLLKAFVWTGSPALDGSSKFCVVIDGGADTTNGHWKIGVDTAAAGFRSADSSSWTATTYSPYYRITPAHTNFTGKFFEYKRGLYMVTQPYSGNSALYINGDRGVHTGTFNSSYLIDTTKSAAWVANEWIGDVVLITKGPGSEETQNWRTITASSTTTLTVSGAWNITHTTATEYVILGSDKWTVLDADLDNPVTDVAVAGEFIYFAKGDATYVYRQRFYNLGGVWTSEAAAETTEEADLLLSLLHSDSGNMLYGADNDNALYGVSTWIANAHGGNNPLHYEIGELVNTTKPWDAVAFDNVSLNKNYGTTYISILETFTTGFCAAENLPTPVDITEADYLSFWIKSSAALTVAGDIEFVYSDAEDLGATYHAPVKALKADYSYSRQPTKVYHLDEEGASPTYTDLPNVYDGIGALNIESVNIEDDDGILIGYSTPFDSIYVDVGTDNEVVATVSVIYYNGQTMAAAANINDGTLDTGASFGQDGEIYWDMPTEWVLQTINSVEAYWVYLRFTAALTNPITIARIYINIKDYPGTMDPVYDDLTKTYDGDGNTGNFMTLGTEDYLYVGYSETFNTIYVDMGVVNDIASVMTGAYWDGSAWTAVTIVDKTNPSSPSDGDTLKQDQTITWTIPEDWEVTTIDGTETYWIRLDVSVALSTIFSINGFKVRRFVYTLLEIPALLADVWTHVSINLQASAYPLPDCTSIKSVGINVDSDEGYTNLSIHDVKLAVMRLGIESATRLPNSHRITGMEAYSGNADDPVENPWIFTEKGVYELQTQNDDQVVAIPLKELATLQSSENGVGHTVNGTYLFFNIGEKIERYFNRTLDDVGPDRDEGLPDDRPGIPISMTSYPGRIYTAIDANDGTSSVLTMRGTSWSEVYRAPRANERIRCVYLQAIPGTNVDRLWISMHNDILQVPVSLHPYNETDFTYQHEGHLITSWIYAGMMDVQKLWKSLKVFAEDVGANYNIVVDYQKDVETTWTEIGTFDTAPVEEIDIASTIPAGKRIRYRPRFISNDVSESPRLKAIVTEGVAFVPVKDQYSFTFALKKGLERIDRDGLHDDSRTPAQDHTTLRGWANDGQVLTFATQVPMADSKTVWINPMTLAPLSLVPDVDEEIYVCQLDAIEV